MIPLSFVILCHIGFISLFVNYKYYPDIAGNNLNVGSWGTVLKHLKGNLVFKPNHKHKVFYDNLMLPWNHYIPVADDYSDLEERYRWAESNPILSACIAWRGYRIASNYICNIKQHFIDTAITMIS